MSDEITINVTDAADWPDITNKPSTFTPSAHTQAISTVTGLQTELDELATLSIVTRGAGNYTLALTDAETLQVVTAAAVVTVPLNSVVAFPVGTLISIQASTAGAVSIAAASGVTIQSEVGLVLNAQNAVAGLLKTASDTWLAMGSLKAA